MVITKIEQQKKDKHRYNVYIDSEFSSGLYDDTIIKFGLRTNDKIDEAKLEKIKEYDEVNFGKKLAYSFLSYKQRSEKDIEKKLKQNKISQTAIETIIGLLKEQKYLDDEKYAKQFIENKISRKPLGKRVLKQKLFEKGIGKEITETILSESYPEETETESARILLEKYQKKVKGKDQFEKRRKCFQYLISKGFDYDIVKEITANLDKNI